MPSPRPKVSVIMPTHNRAELLPRSVKSVLRQTLSDLELIIIDDASTDDTPAVVRSFADARIVYIRREHNHLEQYRNHGVEDNPRNDGLKVARGRYIAYLDSDDMYRTDGLQILSDYLDAHPEVGLVYGDAVWHRNLDGRGEEANCNLSIDFGPKIMGHRNIIRTPTVMHRREVIDQVDGFKPIKVRVPHEGIEYVGIEDWDYWLRVSRLFKVKHHAHIVAHKINETSDHYPDPDFDPEFEPHPEINPETLVRARDIFFQMETLDRFRRVADQVKGVTGYLEPEEGYALYLSAAYGPGRGEIVEIGSFLGRSTAFLALGAKTTGRERVSAVDHFRGSPEHQAGGKHKCETLVQDGTTYNAFLENLRHLGVIDHVDPIVADSVQAADSWTKPIRLLFIDGNHSYDASQADFQGWSPHLVTGGLVGFHDIDGWPGVTGFYRDLMGRSGGRWREVAAVGSLRLIQKQ
jgi:predicted O-methyltransferase YrrM